MSYSSLFVRPARNYKIIDGIRAVAIIWVLILHVMFFHQTLLPDTTKLVYSEFWLRWIATGTLGVDLFFVISGFLIGTILLKELKKTSKINFKNFYIRRFLRLIPAYTFAMILGAFFLKSSGLDTWEQSWSNFLYVNNYIPGSYMPWTWSLAIEEQFYIIAPFLLAFILPLFKRKYVFFLILAVIPIVLSYHYVVNIHQFQVPLKADYPDENWLNWFWNYYMLTHLRYGGLLSGVVAAYLHVNKKEEIQRFFENSRKLNAGLIILALAVFFSFSFILIGPGGEPQDSLFSNLPQSYGIWYEVLYRDVFSYAVAFIILACIYSTSRLIQPVKSFLSLKLFYPIAQLSYSAYLFHEMFMLWFYPMGVEYFKGLGYGEVLIIFINGLISIVVILIVAMLMYVYIEQPFQRMRSKLTRPTEKEMAEVKI